MNAIRYAADLMPWLLLALRRRRFVRLRSSLGLDELMIGCELGWSWRRSQGNGLCF